MEQVIKTFLDELNDRVNLITSMDDKLDSSKVDQLKSIIDKYGVLDSSKFNKEDLEYVLSIVNTESTTDNKLIDEAINQFIDDFNTAKKTHITTTESSVNKYRKYIDILNGNDRELFIDFDELNEIMSELGTPIPDKWKIISYINECNINNNKDMITLLNLNSKLNTYNKLYLDNKDLNNYIEESIKDLNIDIDMIPSLSKKIANNTYDENKVKNAMSTIILNKLYNELSESTDDKQKDNLQEMINDTLNYIDDYEDKIVNPIKDIIINYEDLLNEEINKGNDINTYLDISVDDLEKLVGDRDKALALKKLPLIKSMKDTINSIDECDKSSDDLINYLNLLNDLNKLYTETN
ncbi:MAG: hypothetical protein IKP76_04560 [Bacilli bacterium]|nr:hypothetical protein [Bacilli bacterium]